MAGDASALVWKTCRSDRVVRGSRDGYDGFDGESERLDRLGSCEMWDGESLLLSCAVPRRRLDCDPLLAILLSSFAMCTVPVTPCLLYTSDAADEL